METRYRDHDDAWVQVLGIQMDVARQIERPEVIRRAVAGMAQCGYNVCQLYLEDAYRFQQHPAIARENAYSKEFIQEIQKLCEEQGIELIPVIPSLGHCRYSSG